jgi:hypothetical protein
MSWRNDHSVVVAVSVVESSRLRYTNWRPSNPRYCRQGEQKAAQMGIVAAIAHSRSNMPAQAR